MEEILNNWNDYANFSKINHVLAQSYLKDCLGMVLLNLQTGKSRIIKCDLWPKFVEQEREWDEIVWCFLGRDNSVGDEKDIAALSLENIKKSCSQQGGTFFYEMNIACGDGMFKWVELTIMIVESDENIATVRICDVDEVVLMRKIVDLFVYQNYDYLLLIDSKKDSYVRFTGGKGSIPLPPKRGEHYTQDMMQYNKQFVMPEFYQQITDNMQLPNVIQMLKKSDTYSFTSSGINLDGSYRQSRVSYIYSDKSAGLILCARTDVTQIYLEEQEKNHKLAEALRNAQNDPLTGIYNRKAIAELVTRSLETQYRNTATVFFIDVDNFKMLNDTYGHQKGDKFLYFMAQRLREIAGRNGIAGRLGGDEYLLYLSSVRSLKEMEEVGGRICRIFDSFPDTSVDKKMLSCSVGISIYPQDGMDYETLVRKADQALYTSKRYGKNRYDFYSSKEK